MSSFFYNLYLFNSKNKILFYSGLAFLIIILSLLITNLKLKENITDIFPVDDKIGEVESVFNNSSLNSNLIIHIYSIDSTIHLADSIIAVSHQIDSVLSSQFDSYIDQRMLYYPDSLVNKFYDFFREYLPIYLSDKDYDVISEKITKESVPNTVENNYKALMSPLGIFGSKMILNDPFGFVQLPLKNFQEAQFDENFQLYKNHLFSKNKQHLLFFLQLSTQASETSKNGELIEALDRLVEQHSSHNISIDYFGAPAVAVANAKRIKNDISISVTLAVVFILGLIILYFKNWRVVFLVLLPGIFGSFVGLAVMATLGSPVSLISLGVGSIMVGITVDFALHLFTHHRDEESMEKIFHSITQPTLMSSFTTATAFFALIFIKSNALKDLGLFVALSVLSASIFALLVLPHFLPKMKGGYRHELLEKLLNNFGSVPIYKKRWAQGLFIVVTFISLFSWNKITFNSDMMTLNYMPEYLKKSESRLNEITSLSGQKLYLLTSGDDLWSALENNHMVNEHLAQLKSDSLINGYTSLNSMIPDLNTQSMKLDKWNAYWHDQDTLKLHTIIREKALDLGFKSNAYKGLKIYLDKDYHPILPSDLQDILTIAGNKYVLESKGKTSVITIINYDLSKKTLLLERLDKLNHTRILDMGHITKKLVEILSSNFDTLISISLLVVFGILLLVYGRIELALITIAPIAIGWLWTLGLMGLFNLSFNIVNIIVCSLIFGLGIDYSIFNMRGLTQKYASGKDTRKSFRVSILLSGMTTIIGIGALVFAQHPALKSIALLAIIGISSVLFLTFFIEEALYSFFIQKRKERGLIPFTLSSFIISIFAFLFFVTGCAILMAIRLLFYIPVFPKKQKLFFHYLIMIYCRINLYVMVFMRKKIVGKDQANFRKPSIIISNHHSFLDIVILLMFNPKVVMITNDWVYNSPFFGIVVRYADFIMMSKGIEDQLGKIQKLVNDGYSIIVFPEGSRSETIACNRFHKGAFYLAEKLQLDIQPIILHGTHHTMPKKDGFYLRNGYLCIKFLKRISIADPTYGVAYKERTKKISKHFKEEYVKIRNQEETPKYFYETIYKNYLFKGPILEWYLRIKLKLESNYQLFHEILPKEGRIIDIGCGYGFLGYSLTLNNSIRNVIGLDYDNNKIEIANNCPVKPHNLQFIKSDAMSYNYPKAKAYILSDILHYLTTYEQNDLLHNLIDKLEPKGVILVRDGDKSKKTRHKGTLLTEFFSTNTGFNKTRNKLNYISKEWLQQVALDHDLAYETIENTKLTSNTITILTKKSNG